jgi:hypothetical protein
MFVTIGKHTNLANPSVTKYDDLHQDIFWYLLQQTQVNQFASPASLREFLIRYLLITEHPLHETAEAFIDEGLLISGTMGDQSFSFYMKDIFHFLGFAATSGRYRVRGRLDEFVQNYQSKKYLIRLETTEEGTNQISQDLLVLVLAGVKSLVLIDSLNIHFREDLSQVSQEQIARVTTFVDYVMQQIPAEIFEDYQAQFGLAQIGYEEYYVKGEEVHFDPWTALPKSTLVDLFTQILGEEHHLVQDYRDAEVPDEDVLHDLQFEIPYIKFAYGVKHGYVTLDDNWYTPHMENYHPNFNLDPLEELAGEDREVYSTNSIYQAYRMEEWMHLIP